MHKIKPNDVALLEAVLFATTEPLSTDSIRRITKLRKDYIAELLGFLRKKYSASDHGMFLLETGGYRFGVKQEFSSVVSEMAKADMPKGLLRCLSIIACHEPIKQSDIVKIIGNRTYEYIKSLTDMGFVVSEKKGRTKILKTTPQFEDYFGTKKEELKKMIEQKAKFLKDVEIIGELQRIAKIL